MDYKCYEKVIDLHGEVIYDDVLEIVGNGNTIKNAHLVRSKIRVTGFKNRVTSCSFHERPKDGALAWLYGGDKYALKRSCNVIDNCEFWDRSISQGTIELVGCGATARNNRLYNQANPYPSIKMIGAQHLVTGNRIEYFYDPSQDDDAGVISIGRRPDWPGGIVRLNRVNMVSDLTVEQLESLNLAALYCDDMQPLTRFERNQIDGFPIGGKLGGGSWNTFEKNLFYQCGRGFEMDARGQTWMTGEKATETIKALGAIPRDSALWLRYGDRLASWSPRPTGNTIANNTYFECVHDQRLKEKDLYGMNEIEAVSSATPKAGV